MSSYPSEEGFLGLSAEQCASSTDEVVIIPFGLEQTVSYGGGTSKGPKAIIRASHEVELFDEEHWCEPCERFQITTLKEPTIPADIHEALDVLAQTTASVLKAGKLPIILGGEHTITAGSIRPFLEQFPDLGILHFDAHADLRDQYEDDPFSHACALRRCLDQHPSVPLVSCGIRNISKEEIPYLESQKSRIHIHWAKDKKDWNVETILAPLKGRPLYITFDVDGFDASLMPATGTPEPGGLFWDDVMPILKTAAQQCQIVGADVNELAPIPDFHSCDFLAAKLVYKILGYHFCAKVTAEEDLKQSA